MVEQERELPLEYGCTLFEEVHDSTTLEPTNGERFKFLREVHVPTLMDLSYDENFSFIILWVSWFFLLHPTLPNFAAFILIKYG